MLSYGSYRPKQIVRFGWHEETEGGAVVTKLEGLEESYWPATHQDEVRETTVGGLLLDAAERASDEPGLVARSNDPLSRREWTYGELAADANAVARALLGRFEPGERVAVWAPNIAEWYLLQLGAALAGVVLVTVNPAYRPAELSYVLRQSRAAGVFLVPEFRGSPMASFLDEVRPDLPELREVVSFAGWAPFVGSGSALERLPAVGPSDPAQIQYTSGTTGFPKGVVLHHRGITNNARFIARRYEVAPGERWLNFMPLFHVAGCTISALGSLAAQATQVLCGFEPGLVLEVIEAERCALFVAGATMIAMLADHPSFATRDLSSLRTIGFGGMTAPPALVQRVEQSLGVRVGIMFGLTEACGIATQVCLGDADKDRAETVGRAHPATEVKIAELGSGRVLPLGAVGELCVRGYLVMTGYFEMPDATAAAIDADGWLHTGDLGTMDERGFCRVAGRVKELINRGAEKISPVEIEEVLVAHPGVAAAAVVGIPDPIWGEVIAAFVQPSEGWAPDAEELFALCRRRLAPYKTPRHWTFVDSFPLTPSGKVQKHVLRDRFVAERETGV
jgi:fatty-acyl-CoA synthase